MYPEYSLQQQHQPTITAVRVELLDITNASTTGANQPWRKTVADASGAVYVKSVFIIHVGGTRCVTSSTDNIMKIHARITLTVECIPACIFMFLFYV